MLIKNQAKKIDLLAVYVVSLKPSFSFKNLRILISIKRFFQFIIPHFRSKIKALIVYIGL